MKILILSIILLLSTSMVMAQSDSTNCDTIKHLTEKEKVNQAGTQLIKYYDQQTKGMKQLVVGSIVSSLGSLIMTSSVNTDRGVGTFFLITGTVISLVGTANILIAPKHIKKAGILMSSN